MPADPDRVFLSAPARHGLRADALSAIFRARGTRVGLAGSHARASPKAGARPADTVVTACDRQGVEDVLAGYGADLASGGMDVAPVTPYTRATRMRTASTSTGLAH